LAATAATAALAAPAPRWTGGVMLAVAPSRREFWFRVFTIFLQSKDVVGKRNVKHKARWDKAKTYHRNISPITLALVPTHPIASYIKAKASYKYLACTS